MFAKRSISFIFIISILLSTPLPAASQHSVCSKSQWVQQSPDPYSGILPDLPKINAVWGISPTSIYAVGNDGWILHFDGIQWTKMFIDSGSSFRAVWGSSDQDVWAVGSSGKVFWFDGKTWHEVPGSVNGTLVDVHGGGGNVFIIGHNKICGADTSNYWLVKDLDYGNTDLLYTLYTIWVSDEGHYCAGGNCLDRISYVEYGVIFGLGQGSSSHVDEYRSIWGVSEDDIFALGKFVLDRRIVHYDGIRWSLLPNQPPENLEHISGTSTNDIFGATDQGKLAFFDGTTWSMTENSPDLTQCGGIWGASQDDIHLVGNINNVGKIVHFDGDEYHIWDGRVYQIFGDLKGVWAFAPDDAYAVGADAGIYHYNGLRWTLLPSIQSDYNGLCANSPNDIFAVTGDGYVVHYDGIDWSWWRLTSNPLWDIAANANDDIYAVGGPFHQLFHYDGNSWTGMHDLGSTCNSVFCIDGVTFVGTVSGDIWRFNSFDIAQRIKYPNILTVGEEGRSIKTIWGSSSGTLYIGGNAPHLVQLDGDTGGIEQLITPDGYNIERVTAVYGRSGKDVFVATRDSTNRSHLFRFDGLEMHHDTTHNSVINDIFMLDDCTGFAVGDDSLVLFLDESEDPTPVLFQQFTAAVSDQSVMLFWDVSYDAPIEAFCLYRWESTLPDKKILRARIVPSERSYKDNDVRPGVSYFYLLLAVDRDGFETWSHEISALVPVFVLELMQNYPNPFNPSTTICFRNPDRQHVRLAIYDVSGTHVVTLFDAPCGPGEKSVRWDAQDSSGNPVSSGIYFYQLKAGSRKLSKKMVLLR
jgi:hypothetical protein